MHFNALLITAFLVLLLCLLLFSMLIFTQPGGEGVLTVKKLICLQNFIQDLNFRCHCLTLYLFSGGDLKILVQRRLWRERNLKFGPKSAPKVTYFGNKFLIWQGKAETN